MSHDDEQCLKLGREVVRMIRDLRVVPAGDAGYGRRTFTFPGGAVVMFLMKDAELADHIEKAIATKYQMGEITPPSQRN